MTRGKPKVLKAPSAGSSEKELVEGGGVHNPEENLVGLFLGFCREFPEDGQKLFEDRII